MGEQGRRIGRNTAVAVAVLGVVGVVATTIRWAVDPSVPSSSCLAGGGTAAEAAICAALDVVAPLVLWTLIVVAPGAIVVAAGQRLLDWLARDPEDVGNLTRTGPRRAGPAATEALSRPSSASGSQRRRRRRRAGRYR